MGLYIQECPKMRYKGAFKGTRLLCSYTHQFVPIEFAKDALEKKESRLYPDEEEAERIHEYASTGNTTQGLQTMQKGLQYHPPSGIGSKME